MKDQPSNTDDDQDDDQFECDENGDPTPAQVQRWRELDEAAARKWLEEGEKAIAEAAREWAAEGFPPHLITRDELLAAGALDVPAAWRKSLGGDRDLFADVSEDASPRPNEGCPAKADTDGKASS